MQGCITFGIALDDGSLFVIPAIGFDDQPRFFAEKVDDKAAQRVLAPKLGAPKAAVT